MRALTLMALVGLAGLAVPPADAADRVARFRALGLAHGAAEAGDPAAAAGLADELLALVDAEVLDSLRTGGPFASAAFVREQLEALGSAWGGMSLGLVAAGRRDPAAPLVAVLGLAGATPLGSVRVYGGRGEDARLVAATTHPGRPEAHAWPAGPDGAARLAVSWTGAGAPHTGHRLWLEIWRLGGAAGAEPLWRSAEVFPAGLAATGVRVRPGEITIRYAASYEGWRAGCAEQTEHEDVFRGTTAGAGLRLASRRVLNPWHRELHEALGRFFRALGAGDRRALATLVPDPRVRDRLPARLAAEGACDQREPAGTGAALVAATEAHGDGLHAWSLRWVRRSGAWQLTAATPVLQ